MLDFHQNKMLYFIRNEKKQFPTNMLVYLVIHKNYATSIYIEALADMKCQVCQSQINKYVIKKYSKLIPYIIVSINSPCLSWYLFIFKVVIDNIQCLIILRRTPFLFTTITKKCCQHICYHYGFLSSVHLLLSIRNYYPIFNFTNEEVHHFINI